LSERLIIFDFDGTLADSFDVFLDAFDLAAGTFRFRTFDRENLVYLRSLSAQAILKYHHVASWKLPLVARAIRRHMGRSMHKVRLVAGMQDALAHLRSRGVALALLTSNSHSNVKQVLGCERLAYFHVVECGTSLFGKAQQLRNILKRFRGRADDVLYVGDETRDADAAREAGLDFVAVSWGYTNGSALLSAGAWACVDTPFEMASTLLHQRA
jgi:phosphoglycolate phosphatase